MALVAKLFNTVSDHDTLLKVPDQKLEKLTTDPNMLQCLTSTPFIPQSLLTILIIPVPLHANVEEKLALLDEFDAHTVNFKAFSAMFSVL